MRVAKLMRGILGAAALVACISSHAAYTINISQVGLDVIASGSGSINTSGLPLVASATYPLVHGNMALLYIGGAPPGGSAIEVSSGGSVVGPTSFGTSLFIYSDAASGRLVGIIGAEQKLFVPPGYVSGTLMSSSATWNGQTIAGLGITPGAYTWTWGAGPTADSFTVNIGVLPSATASIPTLSEWGLIGLSGLIALFGVGRVRRRS